MAAFWGSDISNVRHRGHFQYSNRSMRQDLLGSNSLRGTISGLDQIRFYPPRTVVRAPAADTSHTQAPAIVPNIFIVIAVDVAYLIGQQGKQISSGIYMMDNRVMQGSSHTGALNLETVGQPGDIVAWNAVPIDPYLPNQRIEITFVQICLGTVFGSPPFPSAGNGYSWLAQLMYPGTQSYAIQIKVTEGLNPVSYYINWQATISC
jgi:hypothetical protein